MPIADVTKKSLGELAYLTRQSIREETRREAAEGWLRWKFANLGKFAVFFGPTGAFNVITNWRQMKLMHIDFSGGLPSDSKVGKLNCVYGYAHNFQPFPLNGAFAIFHDDPRGGIWQKMSQPPRIISIGWMDRSTPAKDFILITGWVLDGVLDPIKVQKAFSRLVDIWPVLSARLRKRPDGSWEYQIPTEFTPTRPKYIFKCVPKPGLLTQTYPYPKLSTRIVAHWIDPDEHVDLFSEGGPRSVKDYLEKDIPLLQLQLTTFEDASILGLTFPHVLCDAHGIRHIALALSRLLKGEEVLPMKEGDPFERYMHNNNNNKEMSPPKAPPNYKVLGIAQTVVLIIYMIWNYLWTLNANAQSRLFYIPAADVKRLKAEAMADLKRERPDDKDAWVSTSDTIGAFFIKNAHISSTSKKRLSVSIVVNLRNYLPNVVPSPYLHNAVASVIVAPTPIAEVAKKSLGEIAYLIRQSLRAGTHQDAAEGWVRWTLANFGKPMVFFDSTGKYNVITNWREMKLMDIDFSGGLSSSSSSDSKGQKVNCVYGYANSFQPWSVTDSFALFHDDPRGGMWAGGYLPKSVWENPKGFGQYETIK
ncbi:hypothetical protein FRC17_002782 [Serendipita sp. 399]|nr:hypothetical protein FRC17_002782 [Serendipita sp. 399]